ncbi:MAG: hypothetical protein J6C37_02020 [Roseburia sp.]|nr:hypothetical protein [Roseburia sp.]
MKELTVEQRQRRRTIIYIYILLALLILLVAASYTWFSISQTPRVSSMELNVSAGVGIELAETYDARDEEWGQVIDFQKLIGEDTILQPASWSARQGAFVTASYGSDGRTIENKFTLLTDEQNANRSDMHAYYVKGTFYARSDAAVSVYLGEAVEVNEGVNTAGTYVIGMPVWNEQTILHEDGGMGAETAIRIGFRITPVDEFTGREFKESEFYIYEPNCDVHIDENIEGEVITESVDGGIYEGDAYLISQTASSWSEAYPVQQDVTIKSLGKFTSDPYLFSLDAGSMVRIDLYIWLEGQDVDCTNLIDEAQIIANVQFSTEYGGQSGLVDIPGR